MEEMSERMRIAMMGHKRIPSREGGIEIVVEELCVRMVQAGCMVTCYNRRRCTSYILKFPVPWIFCIAFHQKFMKHNGQSPSCAKAARMGVPAQHTKDAKPWRAAESRRSAYNNAAASPAGCCHFPERYRRYLPGNSGGIPVIPVPCRLTRM